MGIYVKDQITRFSVFAYMLIIISLMGVEMSVEFCVLEKSLRKVCHALYYNVPFGNINFQACVGIGNEMTNIQYYQEFAAGFKIIFSVASMPVCLLRDVFNHQF